MDTLKLPGAPLAEDQVIEKIYLVREQKVMLDRDLAALYRVETKVLKQSVKRNLQRFPADFMFEMTAEEFRHWKSQNVTSNPASDKMGWRHPPFCFTEQGVAMLSSILRSDTAIQVNIQIIRVFTKMKQVLLGNHELLFKLEKIEHRMLAHDADLQIVFEALKKMNEESRPAMDPIGFPYPNKK